MVDTNLKQRGSVALVLTLALCIILLIAVATFGGWAYANMVRYKKTNDAQVAAAVAVALKQEDAAKEAQFVQQQSSPFRIYDGPSEFGSLKIAYPKAWSGYVIDTGTDSPYVNGYFYPGVVPDTQSQNSVFALRVELVQESYAAVMQQFAAYVMQGQDKVVPYAAPKVPNVAGSRVDGRLPNNKGGIMIVLPLRNMTLELWTEANETKTDFLTSILPNFSFSP